MRLTCTVNGEPREVDGLWEGESLLYVLRERLALPGSKNACEQGECGSCSVYLDGDAGRARAWSPRGRPRGATVVTVEGLAAEDALHPIQEAFLAAGAVQCGFCTPGLIVATHDLLARNAVADRRRDPRGAGRQPVPLHGLREDPRRGAAGGARRDLIEGCAVATVAGAVHATGTSSSRATGSPRSAAGRRPAAKAARIDALRLPGDARAGQLPPPPLPVGDARARAAGDAVRVAGRALPDVGADRRAHRARRGAGGPGRAAALRLHDGVRPPLRLPAARATCWRSRSRPRASSASASTRAAARWTSALSAGGLPPDCVVEDRDAILAAYDDALNRFHDPSPGSMCRIALAPCSPFSVTRELMAETRGVRPRARRAAAHPHGRDRRGGGVLPGAVRRAAGRVPRGARAGSATTSGSRTACTSTSARSRGSARRGTGVAHCPSSNARLGAGIAPVVPLVRAGAPVGLGVDGAASNEAGELGGELRQALLRRAAGAAARRR